MIHSVTQEIVLIIFENLSNIDDAARLALTCHTLYKLYKCWEDQILWSIIRRSEYHKYDAALCRLTDMMYDEDNAELTPPKLQDFQHPPSWILEDYSRLELADRPDKQQLKNIRNWWRLASRLQHYYVSLIDKYRNALPFSNIHPLDRDEQEESYLLALYLDTLCGYRISANVSPVETQTSFVSQGKFYRAVMGRTLDIKAFQFLSVFPDSTLRRKALNHVLDMWENNPSRTLRESLEMLDIFEFTSHFLLLQILPSPADYEVLLAKTHADEFYSAAASDTNVLTEWAALLHELKHRLTPFDICILFEEKATLNDDAVSQHWRYLQKLLTFHEGAAGDYEPVERAVWHKLNEKSIVSERAWNHYRDYVWRHSARGKALGGWDSEETVTRIQHIKPDDSHWWKKLDLKTQGDMVYATVGHEISCRFPADFLSPLSSD